MSPSDLASMLDRDVATIDASDPKVSPTEWDGKHPHYHYRRGRRGALADVAQAIREHLVSKWSRTLPTVPGHYWVRLRQGEFETVARVYQRKDELVVWMVACGSAGTPVVAYSGWEWSRAVPEPEEPSP